MSKFLLLGDKDTVFKSSLILSASFGSPVALINDYTSLDRYQDSMIGGVEYYLKDMRKFDSKVYRKYVLDAVKNLFGSIIIVLHFDPKWAKKRRRRFGAFRDFLGGFDKIPLFIVTYDSRSEPLYKLAGDTGSPVYSEVVGNLDMICDMVISVKDSIPSILKCEEKDRDFCPVVVSLLGGN
ncbi:MAG: hypothetical protein GY861_21345 [bacterium]|nr:hypothetical protein [bacterium]